MFARFDEHWRLILADDNSMLVKSLAQRRIIVCEAIIARQGVGDVLPGDVPDFHLTIRQFGVTDTL